MTVHFYGVGECSFQNYLQDPLQDDSKEHFRSTMLLIPDQSLRVSLNPLMGVFNSTWRHFRTILERIREALENIFEKLQEEDSRDSQGVLRIIPIRVVAALLTAPPAAPPQPSKERALDRQTFGRKKTFEGKTASTLTKLWIPTLLFWVLFKPLLRLVE